MYSKVLNTVRPPFVLVLKKKVIRIWIRISWLEYNVSIGINTYTSDYISYEIEPEL